MARAQVLGERVEPGELAREVGVADVLAVRTVDGGERQVADPRREEPGAELLLAGKARLHALGREAAQDRDAVPRLLPVDQCAVAGRLDLRARELVVGELQLLEADHVGLPLAEPLEHEVEPRPQAVDVPGGDAHPDSNPLVARVSSVARSVPVPPFWPSLRNLGPAASGHSGCRGRHAPSLVAAIRAITSSWSTKARAS